MARKWAVLTDGYLTKREAKTAHGVIRYSKDEIVAVVDRAYGGRGLAEVMPDLRRDAPIVASIEEAIDLGATSLLLGVATPGGWMPDDWRPGLRRAIESGLEIANGLHRFLSEDPELVDLARRHSARLWDVRQPPGDIPLFSGRNLDSSKRVVGVVGSDCAVGKMTVALELEAAARERGVRAEFVATGQTGILIAGKGIAVDRVISDFVAGAAEMLIADAEPDAQVLLVEGQGSLWHPAYSAVTLGLLHGSAPEVLVLCHQAGHDAIEEPPYTKLPGLDEMVEVYERTASTVRPAEVACVAVNCAGLDDEQATAALLAAEAATGLPAADVLRGGAPRLWDAVSEILGPPA